MQFLDIVQDTCLWFPEEGTVNLETLNKVGDRLREQYMAEELECMPIFTFGLWSMVKDWGLLPHIKEDFPPRYSSQDVGLTPYNQSGSISLEGTKCCGWQSLSHQPHLIRINFHTKLRFSPQMIWILI
jgi:hypothetical protein